jgi:colanic acid biosynthesis glycosyl transferase WcaI
MKKRCLLIGYNFYPEPTGIGKYNGEMISWLANQGYECTVITAYPYYPYWQVQQPYYKRRFWYTTEEKQYASGGKITTFRCPMYVPNKPSGMRRMLLDLSFLFTASFKLLQLVIHQKFDLVFVVAPSFQFGLLGVLYKKMRNTKFCYHVQDMQIEAARDLNLIKSTRLIDLLFRVEKYIMREASIISSISPAMVKNLQIKAGKPVLLFPNWTDTNIFYPINDHSSIKKEFGFAITDKIILYSGAIGEKQGLEAILHAAKEHCNHDNFKFVICGSGPYKQRLQDLAISLQLNNVLFMPLQPFDKFNRFLNIAEVHLVIQKATASDSVMPSKLTTILAVGGLALITADKGSSLHSLVQQYNMGLLVNAENQQALSEGIRRAIEEDNHSITKNARIYAEAYLSIDSIMKSFEKSVGLG